MTAAMYEQLRKRRPDLRLPAWRELRNTDRHRAKQFWPDDLVGRRAAKLMTREPGTTDRGRGGTMEDFRNAYRYVKRARKPY